jgi:hypothetical protein
MRLGEFGAAQRELGGEKDDFVFCGEAFVVEQRMPAVLMLQLGAATTGKVDESEGFAAIWRALEISLTKPAEPDGEPDRSQFRKFYDLAVEQGVDLNDMMRLVMALFEAQSGRPTQPVSASSPGRSPTSPSSSASSTQVAPLRLRSVDDLVRGDSKTIEVAADPNMIQMGDGELVQLIPTERTG